MPENFEAVFARLRSIMLEAAPGMTVAKDKPGALELRTPKIDPDQAAGMVWLDQHQEDLRRLPSDAALLSPRVGGRHFAGPRQAEAGQDVLQLRP